MTTQPANDISLFRNRLARALLLTRLSAIWEQLWPRLTRPVAILALFVCLTWLQIWQSLPTWLHIAGMILLGIAFLASLWPLRSMTTPTRQQLLARLDEENQTEHFAITQAADHLAGHQPSPVAQTLWQAHQKRLIARLQRIRPAAPRPQTSRLDPFGLHIPLILGAIVTTFYAGPNREQALLDAFRFSTPEKTVPIRVDAWIKPPLYTGQQAFLLTRETPTPVRVPAGSQLTITSAAKMLQAFWNDRAIKATTETPSTGKDIGQDNGKPATNQTTATSLVNRTQILTESGTLRLSGTGTATHTWSLTIIPDQAPDITLETPVKTAQSGALHLKFAIKDDYGVKQARATFALVKDKAGLGAKQTASRPPRPLFKAPEFLLSLPSARPTEAKGQTFRDLTGHPWAGSRVTLKLIAEDDRGQTGATTPHVMTLPMRTFRNPIARALVDLRRQLAVNAYHKGSVLQILRAMVLSPEKTKLSTSVYLGLTHTSRQLARARSDDDLRNVMSLFWTMAQTLENGSLAHFAEALRRAEEALRQALDRGASDKELRKAIQDLRTAMRNYIRAMAEQGQKADPQQMKSLLRSPNLNMVDLDRMLDKLEQLARSGARDQARQMLSQFRTMMENMRAARRMSGQNASGQMLEQLGNILYKQQQLLDQTMRQGQTGQQPARQHGYGDQAGQYPSSRPQQGQQQQGQQPGAHGKQGQTQGQAGNQTQSLQQQQDALEKILGAFRREHGQGSMAGQPDQALKRAQEAMKNAADALAGNQARQAQQDQGQALKALRDSAKALVQKLRQAQGRNGQQGRQGRQTGQRTDPLGRPLNNAQNGFGEDTKVPTENDFQRARSILQELRNRLQTPGRQRPELDYLERLLERFQ